jgi:diacylglycerol O-acyltransferase / wax synthase
MQRVEGMDVVFLYAETAAWPMHVAGLTVLEAPEEPETFYARVRSLLQDRLPLAPVFRCTLRGAPLGLDHPLLVDDGELDVDHHMHRVTVPAPGTRREVGALAGELVARRLDRSARLWEFWVIDGLQGGEVAVLTKVHHAIIDGTSGADLTAIMMDPGPVPRDLRAPWSSPPAEHAPSGVVPAWRAVQEVAGTPLRTAKAAAQLARQGAVAACEVARGTAAGLPFQTARSALNGALTPRRTVAFTDVPLADVRSVSAAFAVKVNDVVLAMVSGALRAYLDARGELPTRPLVAEVPVGVRTAATKERIGTEVGNMFVSLATHVQEPVPRLRAIARSAREAKDFRRRIAAHKRMSMADVLPPVVLGAAFRGYAASGLEGRVPPICTLIVSSVPGPPGEFYVAGARVLGEYPIGPLLYGTGLNVTALTMGDHVHFGIAACPDIVADPWPIADGFIAALDELRRAMPATGRGRARGHAPAPRPLAVIGS